MPDEQIKIGLAVVSGAGTKKTLDDLAAVRKQIADLTKEFKDGKKDVTTFTSELTKLEKQAKTLDKALDTLGEKRRIDIDSGALVDPAKANIGGRLRTAGRELRNLPSMQIPGLGIGTDAIGNLTRMTGALVNAGEKSKLVTAATNLLTPALGAQAAATTAALAPIGLAVAGFVALGAALKVFVDATSQNADEITALVDAQLDLNKRIAEGLTTAEARQELDELTETQKRNQDTLTDLKNQYAGAEQQAGALSGVMKVLSGDEEALATKIGDATKLVQNEQAQIDILTKALEDGSLAANDAAEAEKKLAEERTAAVLDQAAAAGQEEAARRKALDATEEQNQKRLDSIEDERAAIEAQLGVLQSSGDTSEKVSDQIAKLNGQLSSLGKESSFIKDTALAVSRARDAEKKSAKEAEDAAKKATAAQEKYTDKVKDAGKNFQRATQDIARKAADTAKDNATSFGRDLADINQKLNDDQIGATIKASADERNALKDHLRAVEDIRRKSDQDEEEEARENRNFIDLTRARKSAQQELNEQGIASKRGADDRRDAFREEQQERQRQGEIARRDRITAYGQQAEDFQRNVARELRDARIAKNRQLADAAEAHNAELKQLHGHLSGMLQLRGQFYTAERNMLQGMMGRQAVSPTSITNTTSNQTTNNITAIGTGGMLSTMRAAGFAR